MIITLCGSTRFPQAFELANMHYSALGHVVIGLAMYGHTDHPVGAKFMTADGAANNSIKERLDENHKRKIDLADAICVVDVCGYMGSSTLKEIEYAQAQGKRVFYLFSDI